MFLPLCRNYYKEYAVRITNLFKGVFAIFKGLKFIILPFKKYYSYPLTYLKGFK